MKDQISIPIDQTKQSQNHSAAQLKKQPPYPMMGIQQNPLMQFVQNSKQVQQQATYNNAIHHSPAVLQQKQQFSNIFGDQSIPPTLQPKFATMKPIQKKEEVGTSQDHQSPLPIQQKKNNTGLPDNLKSGVENLSGYSMDDVKVHYNSNQPAQLNAHAYAQGTDIHLGSGQEKHLPHEAWHVVQQKQGRVKPSKQLKGKVNVNDDKGLEREADIMGNAAINQQSTTQPFRQLKFQKSQTKNISQRKVIQMVSTQIGMRENQIESLTIRGRPKSIYSSTMGDHTTAFIVQTEGIAIALTGKTLQKAIEYVERLVGHLHALPGLKLFEEYDESTAPPPLQQYLVEKNNLQTSIQKAKQASEQAPPDHDQIINHLQDAIDYYLSARELIPLSTINLAVTGTGKAGKGHGESAPAKILSNYERDPTCGISKETLLYAAYRLFDAQSASMLTTQNNSAIRSKMTGGLNPSSDSDHPLLEVIWQQHVESINHMFPKVYEQIADSLNYERFIPTLQQHLIQELQHVYSQAFKFNNQLGTSISNYFLQQSNQKRVSPFGQKYDGFIAARLGKIAEIQNQQKAVIEAREAGRELQANLSELVSATNPVLAIFATIGAALEKRMAEQKVLIQEKIPQYNPTTEQAAVDRVQGGIKGKESEERTAKDHATYDQLELYKAGHPYITHTINPPDRWYDDKALLSDPRIGGTTANPVADLAAKSSEGGSLGTMASATSDLSVKIRLNAAGEVTEMTTGGRPSSPHKGTMGAHTTAWIVHLDRIEGKIKGKDVSEAIDEAVSFSKGIINLMHTRLAGGYPIGDNVNVAYIQSHGEALNRQIANPQDGASILTLQSIISDALSLLNIIPGVSERKIDTTGHAEGRHRKVLKKFNKGGNKPPKADVEEAIERLFDGSKRGKLYKEHKEFIHEAYPEAYIYAYGQKPSGGKRYRPY